MGQGIYILGISLTEQEESAARAVCLGSHVAVVTMVAVTRLVWLDSARTLRVVAKIIILLPHPRYYFLTDAALNAAGGELIKFASTEANKHTL